MLSIQKVQVHNGF